MSGFVAMQREALDHPLFRGNPERFYAWFWLVARAAWKPTPFDIGGKVITLERGQICASIRQLGEAWGMSKSAADRFITRLKTETMVEVEAGHGRLVITICNYGKYQDSEKAERDSSGTATGTAAGQQRDIKEPLNQITSNLEPNGSCASDDALKPEHVVERWNEIAGSLAKPRVRDLTPERRQLVKARIAQYSIDDFVAVFGKIQRSAFLRGDTGWRGCTFDWSMKKANFQKILEGNYDEQSAYGQQPRTFLQAISG